MNARLKPKASSTGDSKSDLFLNRIACKPFIDHVMGRAVPIVLIMMCDSSNGLAIPDETQYL